MMDMRPVFHPIGKVVAALGLSMSLPMAVDWWFGDPHWIVFLECGLLTFFIGTILALATQNDSKNIEIEQAFVLTAGLWAILPVFGALPFVLGAPHAGLTDAYFEAMSGLTTTGTTAFAELDPLPRGTGLWRGILHWIGGLGIVVVAMIFLPIMKVGGMQFFKSEGFDTLGKILPRAGEIAAQMTQIYVILTIACIFTFVLLGMGGLDAVIHALGTVSTGGFSNYDASFGKFLGAAEWAACVFMILASIPFIRMVQAMRGQMIPLWRDIQVRTYFRWMAYACIVIILYRLVIFDDPENLTSMIRETVFNTVSVFSGTGFTSTDMTLWGHFPLAVLIFCGLIGGCTGSTGCSVKIFRYMVLFRAVHSQIRRIHSPHRVYSLTLDGRPLEKDVIDSVMAFFTLFVITFGLLVVALAFTGLHTKTALTGAWTAVANIGPVWGPEITANGSISEFPPTAKWAMIVGMYLGRLELVSALVLLLPRFWRS